MKQSHYKFSSSPCTHSLGHSLCVAYPAKEAKERGEFFSHTKICPFYNFDISNFPAHIDCLKSDTQLKVRKPFNNFEK